MRLERADFHVHLGHRTNQELIQEALASNTRYMAVLDRNTIQTKRLETLIREASTYNITIIPGIESSTEVQYPNKKTQIELLSLDFDLTHPNIYHNFDPEGGVYRQRHERKVMYQKEFLSTAGFEIPETWRQILEGKASNTAFRLCQIATTEPHNQPLLHSLQPEIIAHLQKRPEDNGEHALAKFLYWKYFAPGQAGYKLWNLDAQRIIDIVHRTQGVVVIPHPHFSHQGEDVAELNFVEYLFNLGVDGVEGWDADLLDKQLARLCLGQGKLVLGGSGKDANYSNRLIGVGDIERQQMFISPRRLIDIQQYKQNRAA